MSKIRTMGGQPVQPKRKIKKITYDPNEVKILMHCDYNCNTGFGNVAKHFIDELSKDKNYKIVIHAINDFSKESYMVGGNIMVKPCLPNIKNDPFGRIDVLNALYQTDFDILFVLNDVEVISAMMEHILVVNREKKKEGRPPVKIVTYSPIDSEVRPIDLKYFEYIDIPITYTKYAEAQMVEKNPKLENKIRILPHGVDTDVFKKVSAAAKAKQKIKMFGEQNKDAFVFGSVNRNQVRKDIGCLLIAFSIFKRDNPDLKHLLYLHCNPVDPSGINLHRAIERLGLIANKDVFFPENFSENKGLDVNELNMIYNTFDMFVTTTTAEGWGLTITEAMAVKIPIVAPTHTALWEVTKGGQLVEPIHKAFDGIFVNDFEKIRSIADPSQVRVAMQCVYAVIKVSKKTGEIARVTEAYKFVSGLKWDEISKEFKWLLDSLKK